MQPLLTVSNLSKDYRQRPAVADASLTVAAGEAVGLLGANGAGKSTLIKCIMGLVHSSRGSIVHPGAAPAYLPELPQLPVSLSALALLRFKCRACGLPSALAEESLRAVRLDSEAYGRPVRHCSKGMRQRVALALCLCGNPQLVCLDEPMSGLDALGRVEILNLLQQKKHEGAAFLMSSHIVADMVRLCDRVLIMAHGRICEEVTVREHSLAEATALEEKLAAWTAA